MKTRLLFILFFLFFAASSSYGQDRTADEASYFPKGSLSLRSNILTWALLTPSVGVEYKTSDRIGLIAEGAWSHWNLNSTNKYWRMWNVSPQVRYYTGKLKDSYIGAQYTMGEYNLLRRQGKYMGGGLSLGHQFYCGKNLMVDLGVSLGYLHLYDKEKYQRIGGVDYRDGKKTANGYWGPTSISMTFVWKIN